MPSRRQVLSAGAAGVASLAGCAAIDESPYSPGTDDASEWPLPAFDRGYSAFAPDAAAPRDDVAERWSADVGWPSGRPAVAGGAVFVPTASGLVALDVESGEERWTYAPSDQPWPSAPVYLDGSVYVGFSDRRHLAELDAATGRKVWQLDTRGNVRAPPTVSHDGRRLFVGDDTGMVYLVDPDDRVEHATFEVYGPVTALVYDGTLLVGTGGGELYSLFEDHPDRLTGLWRRKLGGKVTAISAAGSVLAVATFGGPVYRLEDGAHAGRTRWAFERGAVELANTGFDVVGTDLGGLSTLQYRTGEVQWTNETSYSAASAVAGDTLYVGGGDGDGGTSYVDAYPLDGGFGVADYRLGNRRWRFETDTLVTEGLAVADGAVFALTAGDEGTPAKAYALDPA